MSLTQQDINNLVKAKHEFPHAVLGLNMLGDDRVLTITCFFPAAFPAITRVEIVARHTGKIIGTLKKVHSDGLFSLKR